eukprot:sb/3469470/
MDDKKYSIINYNTLEKVAHTFHMSELWTRASYYYDLLKNTPACDEMCACITDVANNDILPEIELLALKIKFPGITSGAAPGKPGDGAWPISEWGWGGRLGWETGVGDWSCHLSLANNYAYNQPHNDNSIEYRRVLRDFDFSGPEEEVFDRLWKVGKDKSYLLDSDFPPPNTLLYSHNRAVEELDDHDESECDHLNNEKAWASWRQGFKNMNDFDNYQFAMYMHCKLRDF